MTISSTTDRNDYTGNGATDEYSYGFKIFAKTDLRVTKRDTDDFESDLVVDTDYTVAGVGDKNGGAITLTAGNLPNNYHLTIRRVRPLTQGTDIRNQGDFYPEIHEDAFDHFIMVDQQQQEELNRSIRIPETVTGVSTEMPIPEALKIPRWNAAGTALELVGAAELPSSVTLFDDSLVLSSGNLSVKHPIRHTTAGGTVDDLICTTSPAIASLTNHLRVLVETAGANLTTTPTFAPDGLTAKTIVRFFGGIEVPLGPGDIPGANFRADMVFDASLDKWVLMNPAREPQLTTTQRDALTAAAGLLIYNTTTARVEAYYGSAWRTVVDGNTAETLSGKTLRLAAGSLKDPSGNTLIDFGYSGTPVNYAKFESSDAGTGAKISAQGETNVDLQLEAKGAGRIKFNSGILGAWDATKVANTVYQAATDLEVYVRLHASGGGGHSADVQILTDAANPPTTEIVRHMTDTNYKSLSCKVRKGDYWKAVTALAGDGSAVFKVIPYGS